jgi:hypothetical protein
VAVVLVEVQVVATGAAMELDWGEVAEVVGIAST